MWFLMREVYGLKNLETMLKTSRRSREVLSIVERFLSKIPRGFAGNARGIAPELEQYRSPLVQFQQNTPRQSLGVFCSKTSRQCSRLCSSVNDFLILFYNCFRVIHVSFQKTSRLRLKVLSIVLRFLSPYTSRIKNHIVRFHIKKMYSK